MKNNYFNLMVIVSIALAMTMVFSSCAEDDDSPQFMVSAVINSPSVVEVNQEAILDGTNSQTNSPNPINYRWEFLSRPDNSNTTLQSSSSAIASFIPDVEGNYVISLTVDVDGISDSREVTIQAVGGGLVRIENNITSNTRWTPQTPAGQPDYLITRNVSLSAELTIDPGVIVHHVEDATITVTTDGLIRAIGQSNNPITFNINDETSGSKMGSFIILSSDARNTFEHCIFKNGDVIEAQQNGRFGVKFSTFENMLGGIAAVGNAEFVTLEQNTFIDCEQFGVIGSLSNVAKIDSESNFENVPNAVIILGDRLESSGDTRLNKLNGTNEPGYLFDRTNNFSIQSNLFLSAGVVLRFKENFVLNVDDGYLSSEGTQDEKVLMTSNNIAGGQYWQGLRINSTNANNKIDHTIIEYAGNSGMDLFGSNARRRDTNVGITRNGRASITNSTIRNGNGIGLTVGQDGSLIDFENNTFENNANFAVTISASNYDKIDETTTYTDNGFNGVRVEHENISNNGNWTKLSEGASYRLATDIEIRAEVNIEAGTIISLEENVLINIIEGFVNSTGTSGSPVTFTTANLDAGQFWRGIRIASSDARNNFEHTIFEYGGNTNIILTSNFLSRQTLVGLMPEANTTFTDCTFRNSRGWGIAIREGATVNSDFATVNTFENNASGDIEDYQ
ncbi:MAG: hypothetical protein LAT68_04910 [Cyclobacteriaceae bacterium]|nr:hypothetical protein [Cyclobacteriaceae bacterium]MCH8515652.1 hypothetical protein [Cyclobacteriaceae bacterium]